MITEVDARLREDIIKYAFKFSCEDCHHFEQRPSACSLGFDVAAHRLRVVEPGDQVVFCKAFELA